MEPAGKLEATRVTSLSATCRLPSARSSEAAPVEFGLAMQKGVPMPPHGAAVKEPGLPTSPFRDVTEPW